LNLCAISAGTYGATFKLDFGGTDHIDPSMTEVALSLAIAEFLKSEPNGLNGKTLKLFYQAKDTSLVEKANDVKTKLDDLK